MDAGLSVTPLKARLLIMALSAGVLAIGGVSVAGASSAAGGDAQAGSDVVSVPAAPPIKAPPLPGDRPSSGPGEIGSLEIAPLASGVGCADGRACMWRMNNYEGEKRFAYGFEDSLGWRRWEDGWRWNSSKNRFGNRSFYVADFFSIISCLDPGENRPNHDPAADRYNVQGPGSSCPN